jgi:hypothetical protein
MANRLQAPSLPVDFVDAFVHAPPRVDAPAARPDPDEAALIEEAVETRGSTFVRGLRVAVAISLAFWGALAAVIAWLA